MDVEFPYAEDDARLRLLYRLPLPSTRGDLLVVGREDVAALLNGDWKGTRKSSTAQTPSDAGRAFDVVALPDLTADGDGARGRALLARAHESLRPGGWLVGHVDQACTLRGLLAGRGWGAALAPRRYLGRPAGCALALREAGFGALHLWYVQPNIEAPMGLIPVDPVAARAQFLRLVRASRGHHSPWGYLLRLTLARLGLAGLQQGQLFFWAQRPC